MIGVRKVSRTRWSVSPIDLPLLRTDTDEPCPLSMIFDSTGFTQNVYSAIKTSLVSGTAPPAPLSSHQLYMRFLKRMH